MSDTRLKYLSVCSGIEAASVAWEPLEWQAVGFSEIEPFPCAVLASHYPDVKNYGDLTKHEEWDIEPGTVDVVIGGTPCQSFSVAGLRKGMADPRGNLALVYLAMVNRIRPRWVIWENVPGVLSSNGGRDFGSFVGALGELGYGFAYRVLDAQYWGVAQRRRRVFVVGCLDGWQRAASVLFERESCTWNYPARRQKGEGIAADVAPCIGASGEWPCEIAPTFNAHFGDKLGLDNQHINQGAPLFVPSCFDAHPQDSRVTGPHDVPGSVAAKYGTRGGNTPLVSYAFEPGAMGRDSMSASAMKECSPCLQRDMVDNQPAVAYAIRTAFPGQNGTPISENIAPTLDTASCPSVSGSFGIRRLTPVECERLQGFPDDWTAIPYGKKGTITSDGPRYKAIGNSMAVPVIRWLGERIQTLEGK